MYSWRELVRLYRLTLGNSNIEPRYNICPTDPIDTVIEEAGQRALTTMRWGLVPAWWSKPLKEMRAATFNARAETVAEKPMFREAFRQHRCIIPVSGYYEWQTVGKEKQPWYFTAKDSPILSIAGIWDESRDRATAMPLRSCAMIVTEPNALAAKYHDRMPVLLQEDQIDGWLSGELGREALKPAPDDMLQAWPVSRRVNSSRADAADATLIDPLAA